MFWAQHRAVDVPRYCGFQGPAGVRWTIQSLHGQQGPRLNRREEKAETLGKNLVNGWWIEFFPSARVRISDLEPTKFAKYCLNEVSRSGQIFGNGRWMDVCASSFQWKMEKIAADPREWTGSTPTWLTWPKIVGLFPPEGSVFIGWGVEILLESEHVYI